MITSRSKPLRSVESTDNASPDRPGIQVRFWPVLARCRRILVACNNTTYTNELDCHVIHVLTASSSLALKRRVFTVGLFAQPTHRRKKTFPFIRARQQPARQDIGRVCDVVRSAHPARRPGAERRQRCAAGCDSSPKVRWTMAQSRSWRPDLESRAATCGDCSPSISARLLWR